jgi:DNA-binding NarL/FixJ family response regulator
MGDGKGRPLLFLVEDEPLHACAAGRFFGDYFDVRLASTISQAKAVWSAVERPLAAACIDERLPDGSGLDLVQWLRARDPCLSIVVVTAASGLHVVERARALGVALVSKPAPAAVLDAFSSDALARVARLDAALATVTTPRGLSRREDQILGLVVRGTPREAVAGCLGVAEETARREIRGLLHKLDAKSVLEAANRVLRQVLALSLESKTAPPASGSKSRSRESGVEDGRPSVLVIDDNTRMLTAMERILREEFRILTAPGGAEALTMLAGRDVDLILCDLLMPGTDGLAVLEDIRARRPQLEQRLYFMTGFAMPADLERPILYKPLEIGDVHAALRESRG